VRGEGDAVGDRDEKERKRGEKEDEK